jgi:MoaA/NifB/PqqE/SkfB family radical SAM enzyme
MAPPPETLAGELDWIELVLGFQCNCRCLVCPGGQLGHARSMSRSEIMGGLERGRALGATGAWFGGGEPSLHPDLVAGLERARTLGYIRRRLQTNALRLAYPAFTGRLVDAGLTEASVSVKGGQAATHEAMTRLPGSFDLLARGVRNLVASGVRVEADVLLTRPMLPELEGAVERFAGLGVRAFHLWLVSLHGHPVPDSLRAWLPSLAELGPAIHRAGRSADALGVELSSLHTPPCALKAEDRPRYRPSSQWRLLVVLPDGESFPAEASPMEGGHYLPGCARCAARPDCLGLREDYLQAHGGDDLEPLCQAEPAGVADGLGRNR